MKNVYCSQCGIKMEITRIAIPKFGRIIDVIPPHECSEEPFNLDLDPLEFPAFKSDIKENKFVRKLDELTPKQSFDPGDRRPTEAVKSTEAPKNILSMIDDMTKGD